MTTPTPPAASDTPETDALRSKHIDDEGQADQYEEMAQLAEVLERQCNALRNSQPAGDRVSVPREPDDAIANAMLNYLQSMDGKWTVQGMYRAALAASPAPASEGWVGCNHVCEAASVDGFVCADGECDYATGARIPSAPNSRDREV